MSNAVFRALQKQEKELRKMILQQGYIPSDTELGVFIARTGEPVVGAFLGRVKTTLTRGYEDTQKILGKDIREVDFSVPTHAEAVYYEALKDLHLSNYKGSITNTTTERIQTAVVKGVKEGMTYDQIAKNIQKLDPQVFSKNRADLIAINQVGKAYQFGNHLPMQELWNEWIMVLKYWSTVNDNKVTPSHTRNQNNGWIMLDEDFSGTGDQIAPASDNPRCRCHIEYKVGDPRWGQQSEEIQQILASSEDKKKVREQIENIRQNYSYEKDSLMQNANTNYKGSPAEILSTVSPKGMKEEEAIALSWWKSEQYYNINTAMRTSVTNSDYNGMILNLQSALDKTPMHQWTVWRGVSWEIVQKLENMSVGGIMTDKWFMSSSTSRDVAKRFSGGIMMNIQSRTWRELWDMDLLNESEILFTPGTSLVLEKIEKNVYYFTEL